MVEFSDFTVCEEHEEMNCGCVNAERYTVTFEGFFDE